MRRLTLLTDGCCAGYNVTIDENTPPGLTIFRGITALDTDKPNTPNSDVTYSIIDGNEDKKFSIEGNQKAVVVLRKGLDFERGDSLFNLTILAQVRRFSNLVFAVVYSFCLGSWHSAAVLHHVPGGEGEGH